MPSSVQSSTGGGKHNCDLKFQFLRKRSSYTVATLLRSHLVIFQFRVSEREGGEKTCSVEIAKVNVSTRVPTNFLDQRDLDDSRYFACVHGCMRVAQTYLIKLTNKNLPLVITNYS